MFFDFAPKPPQSGVSGSTGANHRFATRLVAPDGRISGATALREKSLPCTHQNHCAYAQVSAAPVQIVDLQPGWSRLMDASVARLL